MSLAALRTWEDFLGKGSSDATLWMDSEGVIKNTPFNLIENGFMTDFGEDGVPLSFDLSLDVEEIIGHHYRLSRPGAKNRAAQMARQNSAVRPLSESSFVHQGGWVPGGSGEPTSRLRPPRPELETAPNGSRGFDIGVYGLALGWSSAFGSAGLSGFVFVNINEAGLYPKLPVPDSIPAGAVTVDVAMTRKDKGVETAVYVRKIPVEQVSKFLDGMIPVTNTGSSKGRVVQGNRSGVPEAAVPRRKDTGTMPSDFSTMAGRWTPYVQYWLPALPGSGNTPRTNMLGRPGKTIRIKSTTHRVRVAGPDPEAPEGGSSGGTSGGSSSSSSGNGGNVNITQEQTGGRNVDFSNPQREIRDPQGELKKRFPGIFEEDEEAETGSTGGGEETGGGETGETETHWETKVLPYAEKTALYFRLPRMVRRNRERLEDLRCTYWWKYQAETGAITWFRAYDSNRGPTSYFDATDFFDGRIECPGISPDTPAANKKGKGPRVRLIAEDPPTEDTTLLEPPDPSTAPEEPELAGDEELPAGRYAADVQGVLRGGGLTEFSHPGRDENMRPFLQVSGTQTVKIVPQTTVNLLKNAEGTLLDGKGNPQDWTLENAAPTDAGYVRPEDGRWKIGVSTATNVRPQAVGRMIPVGTETLLLIAGTIGARNVTTGTIRLSLRQLDETRAPLKSGGVDIPDLVVADLAAVGETTFLQKYGAPAGMTSFDARTAYVQVIQRLGGTSYNAEGYFEDLRVYPFAVDIGKVEEGTGGEPASFDPTPDAPCPSGSFSLVGFPPEPAGGASEPVSPIALLDFEGGGAPGWTLSGTAPDSGVSGGAAIFGAWGFRALDNVAGGAHGRWLQRQFPELVDSPSALRAVYRFDQLPTTNAIAFHSIQGSGGSNLAYLRLGSQGGLYVVVNPNGTQQQTISLDTTVYLGSRLDVELAFVPGTNGLITVSVGMGGKQREVVFQRNFDLKDRNGDVMRPGVVFSFDAKTRYSVAMDNVVVTKRGDVLDRERPAPPAGVTVPPEDRPSRGTQGALRRFDPRSVRIPQWRTFLNVGEGFKVVPVLDDPVNVRPGLSYCLAAFLRWHVFFGNTAPGIRVWLESDDPDLDDRLAGAVGPMTGERGWHSTGSVDDYVAFTVPQAPAGSPGYTRARVEMAITPGFYVAQELLFAQEGKTPSGSTFTRADMDTFAKRDAMRSYGRAAAGKGEWVLPVLPEMPGLGPQYGAWLSEIGVKGVEAYAEADEEDDGAEPIGSLDVAFATSPDGVAFATYDSPYSRVTRLMRISVDMASGGSGADGPEIPAGGIFARTWTPVGTLTREDGSPFPGGALVNRDLWVSSLPEMESRRVGGRLAPVPLSEVIDRLARGFKVGVATEDALEEILYLSQVGRLRLEIPGLGNTVAGTGMLVRCENGISFEPSSLTPRIASEFGVSHRVLFAVGTCEYAEVLQSGPLQPPMGRPIGRRWTA